MSSIKEFYDKTFSIYQIPVFDHNVLIIEHKDTVNCKHVVRVLETNGTHTSHPTLLNFLTSSPHVDPATRYRPFFSNCESVYTVQTLQSPHLSPPSSTTGFDETFDHILNYIHKPPQANEILLVNHKTDILFTTDEITKTLIPNLVKELSQKSSTPQSNTPHSVVFWISTTDTEQVPIVETIKFSSSSATFYLIVTPDHTMPTAVSSILPFTQPTNETFDRRKILTSLELTFEPTKTASFPPTTPAPFIPSLHHYNNEGTTHFSSSTSHLPSNLVRITKKFTPDFGRYFIIAIPLINCSLVSLTVSSKHMFHRQTMYHLNPSTIELIRPPITLPSSQYTIADIYAIKCYYDDHLKPEAKSSSTSSNIKFQQLSTHMDTNSLVTLRTTLQHSGLLTKHPELCTTIDTLLTTQSAQISETETKYAKITKLFQTLTDTKQHNKVYQLLPREIKSFIHKIYLKNSLPPPPQQPMSAYHVSRNYSTSVPFNPPTLPTLSTIPALPSTYN